MTIDLEAALTARTDGLTPLIQPTQYVGEVFSIAYETAKVQVHDYERRKVGGIPALCFLLATRLPPTGSDISLEHEDSSVILLRVLDATRLPDSTQAEVTRVETARAVSGETDRHWDSDSAMDADTRVLLGYAGVLCRILGTFFCDTPIHSSSSSSTPLRFGSDISNYYPNRGLKVYKPVGDALKTIVNYVRISDLEHMQSSKTVPLGVVRYASTNRRGQGVDVPVHLYPSDLLNQKTAVFGMTRTGKSNTMKIIAQSVYDLRRGDRPLRIGQIIFDSNGEYANENVQDAGALKNIWKTSEHPRSDEMTTYGIVPHPRDPERKLMRLNFYREDDIQTGKEIINDLMADLTAQYAKSFRNVAFDPPSDDDHAERTRYERRLLCYRALLCRAGFKPGKQPPQTGGRSLFAKKFLDAMAKATDSKNKINYANCADVLRSPSKMSWESLADSMPTLQAFLHTPEYNEFNANYVQKGTAPWADSALEAILDMFTSPNRPKLVRRALVYHSPDLHVDYADSVYNDLLDGKLVIVDQSTGDPEINRDSATRIVRRIFQGNQTAFRAGETPRHILVFVEEAHNQLPSDHDTDLRDIWVRMAKEGAKFHIGMVYATQEVSSIQRNMLKNTANWFIGHLNNTDETKELRKYYDFADFEGSILRAQDAGFLRVKTISNPFVIPVQVQRFEMPVDEPGDAV